MRQIKLDWKNADKLEKELSKALSIWLDMLRRMEAKV
jgi:hypothetical protein